MVELKMKLNILEMLLQNHMEEYWCYAYGLRKRVKWTIKELYERKLRHSLSAWLKMAEEELIEAKYGQRSMSEEVEVHIYEPEQAPILGEDDKSEE